ncbi:MAG: DUF3786 domain-containing protein [Candidatus Omnitrophica bacterium]|nr:DUF3786 domain-containing protein [Candidatus Omnitrophota bacterium]MDD5661325.1 DUF3786 domain-containing protein [Candidatus Omnitrophota bacterium]
MGYEDALKKAWEDLANQKAPKNLSVRFMADEYSVDVVSRRILSLSCNSAAKDFLAILLLHYLIQEQKGIPKPGRVWLTFREFSGIEGYYDAYYKRSIEPIIRKYGKNPDAFKDVLNRFSGELSDGADVSIIIRPFRDIPILIKLWFADEEFGPDANIYFDASIKNIFCIEDIVVLAQLVSAQL